MKRLLPLMLFLAAYPLAHAANVRIIESQSFNSGHVMDNVWQGVATGMGHSVTISPQTTLDNNSFFASTDLLIISSGVITLTAPRVAIIQQFVQSGKPVYIQSEYLCNYSSNVAYSTIVNALGGTLTWGNTTAGTLAPMAVNGTMGSNPLSTGSLSYYWYGCYGTPSNRVQSFLTFGGQQFGFIFCPASAGVGRVVTTTDQDWVNQSTNLNLLRNILSHLFTPISCSPPLAEVDMHLQAHPDDQGHVNLAWEASWTNQEGFPAVYELERSLDGLDFQKIFQTTQPDETQFMDQPQVIGQPIFYRLRVVDGDGHEFYSETVETSISQLPGLLEVNVLGEYDRSAQSLSVTIHAGQEGSAQFSVVDMLGKIIWQSDNLHLQAGKNELTPMVGNLAPGTYLLNVITREAQKGQRFLVR